MSLIENVRDDVCSFIMRCCGRCLKRAHKLFGRLPPRNEVFARMQDAIHAGDAREDARPRMNGVRLPIVQRRKRSVRTQRRRRRRGGGSGEELSFVDSSGVRKGTRWRRWQWRISM